MLSSMTVYVYHQCIESNGGVFRQICVDSRQKEFKTIKYFIKVHKFYQWMLKNSIVLFYNKIKISYRKCQY